MALPAFVSQRFVPLALAAMLAALAPSAAAAQATA
jgi:hypothetical protein